jgi:hypothetical protein
MQPAAVKSMAKIDQQAVVCTSQNVRYFMNIIIAPSWVWPARHDDDDNDDCNDEYGWSFSSFLIY